MNSTTSIRCLYIMRWRQLKWVQTEDAFWMKIMNTSPAAFIPLALLAVTAHCSRTAAGQQMIHQTKPQNSAVAAVVRC